MPALHYIKEASLIYPHPRKHSETLPKVSPPKAGRSIRRVNQLMRRSPLSVVTDVCFPDNRLQHPAALCCFCPPMPWTTSCSHLGRGQGVGQRPLRPSSVPKQPDRSVSEHHTFTLPPGVKAPAEWFCWMSR